jgi:hypothetical protein
MQPALAAGDVPPRRRLRQRLLGHSCICRMELDLTLIAHTRHTLQLNEPWDNPRPPKWAWCLFEGYMTMRQPGGTLEVVLGHRHDVEMYETLMAVDRFEKDSLRKTDVMLSREEFQELGNATGCEELQGIIKKIE